MKQTVTEESITTMKSYGRSVIRNELETNVSESTVTGHKQSLHAAMEILPSLEYHVSLILHVSRRQKRVRAKLIRGLLFLIFFYEGKARTPGFHSSP